MGVNFERPHGSFNFGDSRCIRGQLAFCLCALNKLDFEIS